MANLHQPSVKGLETLGVSPSKLLGVPQKVTPKPEMTGSRNREKSVSLEVEPGNPQQLNLFEWRNGEAILHSESPVIAT